MNQKYEKYLPIGSVVLLNGAEKRVMITGFCIQNPEKKEVYDYIGCLYPEGVLSTDRNLLFNHSDIQRIYAIGYSDEEDKKYKEILKEKMTNQN